MNQLSTEIIKLIQSVAKNESVNIVQKENGEAYLFEAEGEGCLQWGIDSTKWEADNNSKLVFTIGSTKVNIAFNRLTKELVPLGFYPYLSKMGGSSRTDTFEISIIETTDPYDILRFEKTDGANYGHDTEAVIKQLKVWDQQYGIELIGAGHDWLAFMMQSLPDNLIQFVKDELYRFCPDMIEQSGYRSKSFDDAVSMMGRIIFYQKFIYFWWD